MNALTVEEKGGRPRLTDLQNQLSPQGQSVILPAEG